MSFWIEGHQWQMDVQLILSKTKLEIINLKTIPYFAILNKEKSNKPLLSTFNSITNILYFINYTKRIWMRDVITSIYASGTFLAATHLVS